MKNDNQQTTFGSAGFTLLELALAFALIVSFSILGTITLTQVQSLFRIRSAADETKALLQLGRELSIANKDMNNYQITLSATSLQLHTDTGTEIARYQPDGNLSFNPSTFTWSFTPTTGVIQGCTLPCQIDISLAGNTQTINIKENGLVY